MTAVAVLGLGAMGRAIAAAPAGRRPRPPVWNRTPGRDEELVAAGARRRRRAADAVRDAEVVDHDGHRPAGARGGPVRSRRRGPAIPESATLIEMSTVGPTEIASVAERLAPVAVLDAPVLGSVPSVESGKLVILTGGDRDGVRPAHRAPVDPGTPIYLGRVGFGRVAEARQQRGVHRDAGGPRRAPCALTDRAGLDDRRRAPGPGGRPARLAHRTLAAAPQGRGPVLLLPSRARAQGSRARVRRGRAQGTELTVAEAAAARCDEAIEAGLGDEDFGAIVPFLRAR